MLRRHGGARRYITRSTEPISPTLRGKTAFEFPRGYPIGWRPEPNFLTASRVLTPAAIKRCRSSSVISRRLRMPSASRNGGIWHTQDDLAGATKHVRKLGVTGRSRGGPWGTRTAAAKTPELPVRFSSTYSAQPQTTDILTDRRRPHRGPRTAPSTPDAPRSVRPCRSSRASTDAWPLHVRRSCRTPSSLQRL